MNAFTLFHITQATTFMVLSCVCKHILPFIMADGIIRQWTSLQEVHLYRSDLEAPSRQCDQLWLPHLA